MCGCGHVANEYRGNLNATPDTDTRSDTIFSVLLIVFVCIVYVFREQVQFFPGNA